METTTKTHEVQTDERIAQTYGEFLAATYDAPKGTDPRTLDEYAIWESAENEYDGWSRFFAVPGGHIHSSMNCSTCQWTTTYGWLPDVSGLDEEAAVEAHGALLCTICFPSAPVEWTNHYEAEESRKQAEACPGPGQPGAEGGSRQGFCAGNYPTCTVCGQTVGGKGYNVRKHKAV